MAIIPQFQASYTATATAQTLQSTGGIMVHTVSSPIATVGTYTAKDGAGSATYFVLPIGTIGSIVLDAIFPNGLQITQSSAADKTITTWQAL